MAFAATSANGGQLNVGDYVRTNNGSASPIPNPIGILVAITAPNTCSVNYPTNSTAGGGTVTTGIVSTTLLQLASAAGNAESNPPQ